MFSPSFILKVQAAFSTLSRQTSVTSASFVSFRFVSIVPPGLQHNYELLHVDVAIKKAVVMRVCRATLLSNRASFYTAFYRQFTTRSLLCPAICLYVEVTSFRFVPFSLCQHSLATKRRSGEILQYNSVLAQPDCM